MSRLAIPTLNDAPEAARPVLDAVGKQLGSVPNLYRLLAASPAVLQGLPPTARRSPRPSTSRRASASRWPSPR